MDKNSVESLKNSVIADAEDEDEKPKNFIDFIDKIHDSFLDLNKLHDHYWKAMEQVKSLDTEELREVLEKYADLEVAIIHDRDGVDPEEKGNVDENVDIGHGD